MSAAGGRRRSLLASAIESIGAAPVATAEPAAPLPAAIDEQTPVEKPSAPSFLERRGAAFDELTRSVKGLTIRLKPSECSIWPGNARDYALLTEERCASLIDSIREEGANREAVVVRRTRGGDLPYELIVGTRRHFCVAWLNANNRSEIDLIARIETLDDEAAFRLADLENREREDVTDLERARNYRHAVETYYGGVRTRMADRLAIPKQNLHNLLQLAELPDAVIAAFAEVGDLKVRHGMRLSPLIKDDGHRASIVAEALAIAADQADRKAGGLDKIDGSKVFERLVTASSKPKVPVVARRKAVIAGAEGKEIGQVIADTRAKGITVNIHPKASASVDEILEALRPVLEGAKFAR
jgi:ParB family chromosome partitioning protein